MTALQERDLLRANRRLEAQVEVSAKLRNALRVLIPGHAVIVFGSLLKPGTFNDRSDVDLALESDPPQMSSAQLQSALEERMGRPVDVVLLPQCRFRQKILREGQLWIG